MTLGEIKQVFLKHMGEYTNDADDPSVISQYEPECTAYINEGYAIIMRRVAPDEPYEDLMGETDEPVYAPASLHSILADYAAGRCMMSMAGMADRASFLLSQFQSGLFKLRLPYYKLRNRWEE